MNDIEKLRVMLPHWITHNKDHGGEFANWAKKVRALEGENSEAIAAELARAVSACEEVTAALEKAMELAGGPLEHHHSHSHGHSDHGHHHHH